MLVLASSARLGNGMSTHKRTHEGCWAGRRTSALHGVGICDSCTSRAAIDVATTCGCASRRKPCGCPACHGCRKKAGELVRSEVFQRMRAVRLSETRSAFWRFHTRGVGPASAHSHSSLPVVLAGAVGGTCLCCMLQNRRRYMVCVEGCLGWWWLRRWARTLTHFTSCPHLMSCVPGG